jgi:hypothetical protein
MRLPEERGDQSGHEEEGGVQKHARRDLEDQAGLAPLEILAQLDREERAADAQGLLERRADGAKGLEQSGRRRGRGGERAHRRLSGAR